MKLTAFKSFFIFLLVLIYFIIVYVYDTCKSATYVQCPRNPAEGIRSPETGITDSCELPWGFWEPNPGSSGRAASTFNHGVISPASHLLILCVDVCMLWHMCTSEDNFWFHCVSSVYWMEAVMLSGECLYLLSHLAGPQVHDFIQWIFTNL